MNDRPFGSPIESEFWSAWESVNRREKMYISLMPQYPVGGYFVDFAHPDTLTAIELDGFATHSNTEDVARDRRRQREIGILGWHVARFGGKEIYQDVGRCVKEVRELIQRRIAMFGEVVPTPDPDPLSLSLQAKLSSRPMVGWSDMWEGWIVEQVIDRGAYSSLDASGALWALHLLSVSDAPVFTCSLTHGAEVDARSVRVYTPPLYLSKEQEHPLSTFQLRWCTRCNLWTKTEVKTDRRGWIEIMQCFGCQPSGNKIEPFRYQKALEHVGERTVFSLAQHLWHNRIEAEQQQVLWEEIQGIYTRPGAFVCKVLVGIAVIQLHPGDIVKKSELGDFFWAQCHWLYGQTNKKEWDSFITAGFVAWVTYKWLERVEKGVYRRLFKRSAGDLPPSK